MIYKNLGSIFTAVFSIAIFVGCMTFNLLSTFASGSHFDNSFNNNGRSLIYFGQTSSGSFAHDVAIQTDGKIVVAGISRTLTGGTQFAIARFNPNGSLDSTFSGDGQLLLDSAESVAITIQSDSKIIIAGTDYFANQSTPRLYRLNQDGSLDATFGTNGRIFDSGNSMRVLDVALQADGKIVTIGSLENNADWKMVRYNANGSRDTSFGGNGTGIVETDFGGNTNEVARALSILSNGRILVAGTGGSGQDLALARYSVGGTLDGTFGSSGKVTTDFNGTNDFGNDMKVQSDGKIVVVGSTSVTSNNTSNFALARYEVNGALDTTFGSGGKVTTDVALFNSDVANGVAIQSDGKIVAVGKVNDGTDFIIVRYLVSGLRDQTFGSTGILRSDINNSSFDYANAVAIQADGKLVVVGTSRTNLPELTVARYHPNSSVTAFDFDGDSKTDIGIFRPAPGEWWYLKSSTGGNAALQFGQSTDKITPGDFTGDGKTDIAFWRPSTGFWFILRSEDNSFFSYPFGANGDIAVPSDYDGDGKTDSAVFRPSIATWYIQRSSDGGTTIQGFGATGDLPTVADYDGDGKADLAIFRPSNGQWWIKRSSNDLVFALQFGLSSDKPVQGDYTGDGKADLAFFRPSAGEWFILRSEDSSFYSFPFGAAGDTPSPGDYDGDGKFDPAVFRPSNSTWYLNQSTAGIRIATFGISGDRPIPNAFVP